MTPPDKKRKTPGDPPVRKTPQREQPADAERTDDHLQSETPLTQAEEERKWAEKDVTNHDEQERITNADSSDETMAEN